jgi:hypothetical protein
VTDLLERRYTGRPVTEPSDPACPARKPRHRTLTAYRRVGCRCPEAVQAHHHWYVRLYGRPPGRMSEARRGHIERLAAYHARPMAQRVAGGEDPRTRWRGPHTRVDRLTVDLLTAGFRFAGIPPTRREFQVAVWRLIAAGVQVPDIATIMGLTPGQVESCRNARRVLRDGRTGRRLADAAWRAWHKHRVPDRP